MQRVTLVRYAAKPDRAEENETLARAAFAELQAKAPDRVAYALFRDGVDFVHLFINLEADDSSPVTELASFKAYAKDVAERCQAPPQVTRLGLHPPGVLRPAVISACPGEVCAAYRDMRRTSISTAVSGRIELQLIPAPGRKRP